MAGKRNPAATPMKSVRTALRLFGEFAREQQRFSVGELAERTGLSKSHVSKVLAAFVESGLLTQDAATREFSVGLRAFVLGARFANYNALSQAALPLLRELKERTGHSTRLFVRDGDEALFLLGVEGSHLRDTGWRAGTWMPFASVPGRILLAFMDPERAELLIARHLKIRPGDRNHAEFKRLRQSVARIRADGFASQRGQTIQALGSVGVPVFGAGSQPIGVIGVAFPVHVIAAGEETAFVEALHVQARSLSLRMGCPVYPFGGWRDDAAVRVARAPSGARAG
jgi:DNA-binding IclR family transcriptional regulator